LEHYADADLRKFLGEAARALELGSKAVLAEISPVLIADAKHIDSQLYLASPPGSRPRPERGLRTISCRDALDRIRRVLPALRLESVLPIIDARDGSIHFLVDDSEVLDNLAPPFVEAMTLIQNSLKKSDAEMFGGFSDVAISLREKRIEQAKIDFAAKLARARRTYSDRYGDLDDNQRSKVVLAITSGYILDGYDEQVVNCPACESSAIIGGDHEFDRWELDYDRDGVPQRRYPIVFLLADRFHCAVCGLDLEGEYELKAAGLETSLDVEDALEEDFADDDGDEDAYMEWRRDNE